MRRPGTSIVVGTTLLALAGLAAPADAQAPHPPAVGTITTVSAGCVGGGTLVVKQTELGSGETHVDVRGKGVPDGRWRGSFSPDASEAGNETDLDVTATGHRFYVGIDLSGVTGDTNTTLVRGSVDRACAIGLTLTQRGISISGPSMGFVAKVPEPGRLVTAGLVLGCQKGSTWKYGVTAKFGDTNVGFGAGGIPCRKDAVKISKSTVTYEPAVAGKPTALSVKARSRGDVEKISYRSVVPS